MTPSVVKARSAAKPSPSEVSPDEFLQALQSACVDASFNKTASSLKLDRKKVSFFNSECLGTYVNSPN